MEHKNYESWDIKRRCIIQKLRLAISEKDKLKGVYIKKYFFHCLNRKKNGTFIKIKLMGISFVNLNLGVKYGNEIITNILKQIKEIKPESIITKISGTNLCIYIEETKVEHVKDFIEKIFRITRNVSTSVSNVKISANIASITYKDDDFDVRDAVNKVDLSMFNAIRKGSNKYEIYNEMYESHINIRNIEKSIENNEITLYYQPKVDVKSGNIEGVEALIRWFSKDYGYITPDKLIGFAEHSGYIYKLGKWILKKTCIDIKELNKNLNKKLSLSVNISPYQLEHEEFLDEIKDIIEEVGFEQELLQLEITESKNIESIKDIQLILKEIRNTGIRVSIDDFGKGYNSIDYIKNYDVDEIKIDKSIVKYIGNNPLFIESLINMVHTTNTSVVAEGVEEKFEYEELQKMGCNLIQGYYCYRPMELKKLLELTKEA